MKKLYYSIILVLILGLVLTGCSLLSNVGQVPPSEQSGISYLVKNGVEPEPPVDTIPVDLLAGKTDKVGEIFVWNDADNLYVKFVYTGTECGFLEVHLQVDEGTFSPDILTKKGNPIPGHFENSYDVGCFKEKLFTYDLAAEDFVCGDELKIAAHAVVPSGGADVDKYAKSVYNVTPGTGAVREPSLALGAPDSSYLVANFYSLGFGGCIELEFADFVGGTLTVYETTWHHFDGDTYPKESADISVSANGSDWTYLGEANNDGQSWSNTPIPNVFILEECIKYVRICDTSDPSLFGSGANAFDIDAIEGQYFCKKETAWGAGIRFVPKGNWATYFKVTVEEPLAPLTLLDQNGNGVPGGKARPACGGSWKGTLPGQTDSNGKLWASPPACFTKIKMTVNQSSQEQSLTELESSNYTWYTVPLVIELRDDQNNLLSGAGSLYSPGGGRVDQGGGTWVHHGYTDDAAPYGQYTVQVFGGQSFKFRMGWEKNSQTIVQFIPAAGGTITFQTGKVIFETAKSLSLGSWVPFPAGTYQFLPGTYNYSGGSFTVTAGGTVTVP